MRECLSNPCPSCLHFISPFAQLCPRCQTEVRSTTGLAAGELEHVGEALAKLIPEADVPVDLTGQPGRFGVSSHVFAVLGIGALVLALAGSETGSIVAGVFAALFGVVALLLYARDLGAPSVRDRRTGKSAVRCYLKAIQRRRWRGAFACLSVIARGRRVYVPPIPELRCKPQTVVFGAPDDIKTYWTAFAHPSFGAARRIQSFTLHPAPSSKANLETYVVELNMEYYPSWIALFVLIGVIPAVIVYLGIRELKTMRFHVSVLKVRSQWWLLSGEIYPRLDRALLTTVAQSA